MTDDAHAPADVHERRLRAAAGALPDAAADLLVVSPGRNLQYLTGLDTHADERPFFLLVPPAGDPTAFVPELAAEGVRATPVGDAVRTWGDDENPRAALSRTVADLGLAGASAPDRLLVDDAMPARHLLDLRAALPDATVGLASEVLAPLRRRKDDAEVDALRRAGAVADAVVDDVRAMGPAVVGLTERELAWEVERRLREAGGEGVPFGPIVASGPNGAVPHHEPGDRTIAAGDPVVLDFGTRVDGYVSDQTRTLVFDGRASEAVREVHDVVRRAQEAAVEAVEPGVVAGTVDRAAREVIEAAGYGDRFVHRTGHGVGLDVHEEPYVAAGSDVELDVGMAFSIEPGVYLPGEFGVRIEDLVVVTPDGAERLNDTDRGWQV